MILFTSIDLQKRTGNVQRAAAQNPIAITSHGQPRNVMLSVEEFRRLKQAAGEAIPAELRKPRAVTVRPQDDPLGYDVSDLAEAARQMAEDVASGRTDEAVQAELAAVRAHFGDRQ